jgi:hypothetical protein
MQPRRRPCRRCALAQPREHLTRLDCGSRPPREARQAPQLPTAPAPSRAFSTTLAMVRHARAQPRPVETPSLVRIPVAVLTVLVPRRVSCRQRHGATSERRVHRGPACRYLRLPHAVARPQRRSGNRVPSGPELDAGDRGSRHRRLPRAPKPTPGLEPGTPSLRVAKFAWLFGSVKRREVRSGGIRWRHICGVRDMIRDTNRPPSSTVAPRELWGRLASLWWRRDAALVADWITSRVSLRSAERHCWWCLSRSREPPETLSGRGPWSSKGWCKTALTPGELRHTT